MMKYLLAFWTWKLSMEEDFATMRYLVTWVPDNGPH